MQFADTSVPQNHRLFYGSSYDRGLEHLLYIWDDIKKQVPDATLHIAYGWDTFDRMTLDNPERKQWKNGMVMLMQQKDIFHYGRLSKEELKQLRQHCGIWAYPTHFYEIFCITAIEAQKDGLVPITTNIGSLPEVVHSGSVVTSDILTKVGKEEYTRILVQYMKDRALWEFARKEAKEHQKQFSIDRVASEWKKMFEENDLSNKNRQDIKVSIITPTIRKGFGNIMANNLSKQTYKNIEWVIVDDYVDDRSKHFSGLSAKYGLDISYIRGKPQNIKRKFALANANNTGYLKSKGELIVILQDFILIPDDGIEQLVNVHKKHPNALIAPIDMQAYSKIKENPESEDWYAGEVDVIGEIHHTSIRNTYRGLRKSDNPFEFEQNYCAIPRRILDMLGGWYECMDEGLGYDNTEFAWRAIQAGCSIYVDEFNVAVCLDHWEPLKDKPEQLGAGRERSLNDPRYLFLQEAINKGLLPIKVDQNTNDSLDLQYEMPEDVVPKDWILKNANKIATKWLQDIFNI